MAVTASDMKARFPEFLALEDSFIDLKLAEAAIFLDATVWGSRYDTALGYQAAHLLAITPFGRDAHLSTPNGVSTYGQTLDLLKRKQAWAGVTHTVLNATFGDE